MRVSAKTVFAAICLSLLVSLPAASPLFAADAAPEAGARYERAFGAQDFKIGRDALKYEMPEGGMLKIMPRLQNSFVFTRFDVAEEARLYKEWVLTAAAYNSESPATGVGLWNGDSGHVVYVFPDGSGRLQYFEGDKAAWSADFKVLNFSYPARITLERDMNGSFIARVGGVVAAVRILEADLKKPKLTPVTAVSFVTCSTPKRAGAAAYFERLEFAAWGARDVMEGLNAEGP